MAAAEIKELLHWKTAHLFPIRFLHKLNVSSINKMAAAGIKELLHWKTAHLFPICFLHKQTTVRHSDIMLSDF